MAALDHTSFPHIIDSIIAASDDEALVRLRATSSEMRRRSDARLKARGLVWTARGVFCHSISPRAQQGVSQLCPVRSALAERGLDPLPPNAPVRLVPPIIHRSVLPSLLLGVTEVGSIHDTMTKVLHEHLPHISTLDIWPDSIPRQPSHRRTSLGKPRCFYFALNVNVLRVWPGNHASIWLFVRCRTAVFYPSPLPCGVCFKVPRHLRPSFRAVIHVGGHAIDMNMFYSLLPGQGVVLIFDPRGFTSNTSYIGWLVFIRFLCRYLPSYGIPLLSVGVDFPLPAEIQLDLSAHNPSLPTIAETLHDRRDDKLVRLLSLDEYAAEVGPEQFELEMGHQRYAWLDDEVVEE